MMFFQKKYEKEKIGILCICTGKYIMFFDGFYTSSERNLLKSYEKFYYVFTDGAINGDDSKIFKFHQEKLGWPYDTLKRFHMFSSIKGELSEMNYLFFFNINMFFNSRIGDEILPKSQHNHLVGVRHPAFYNKKNSDFSYERREESTSYIPFGQGKHYYQGCLSGGRTDEYLLMSEELKNNIDRDLENNFVAQWHDESHLNRYFLDRKPKVLPPSYAYPESWRIPFRKRIIQLDKNNFGGHDFLRE